MKNRLRFFIGVLLVLGVWFRFVNLDGKFYWYDEVFTSLRVSGYTETEAVQQVSDGQVIGIPDLQKYQHPNQEKSVIDTIKGLAVEEPQLPPLYFVLARFWVQGLGYSVVVIRSLSALISLLAFPCLYWLCRELFTAPEVVWMAMGLLAVSPFHILYAQEARPYSLYPVMVLLSCASLLRAMRRQTKLSWGIYSATVALGLYTHLFCGLVAIGHGIYVVVNQGCRWKKTVASYLLASIAALLVFAPWILILIANFTKAAGRTNWSQGELDRLSLVKNWVGNLSRVFFDFGITSDSPSIYLIPFTAAALMLLILVGYGIYFLCGHSSQRVWLFILTLIGVTALAVMLPDLIWGGIRSTKGRYLFPCYLGIQIAVAYLLTSKMISSSVQGREQQLWKIITILVVSSGVVASAISSQAQTWWSKEWFSENPQVAEIINQGKDQLVVSDLSDASLGNVVSLSYLLDPQVQFQLVVKPTVPKISEGFSDIFLYGPATVLRFDLAKQQHVKIEPVYKINKDSRHKVWLWKLTKQ